MKQTVISRTLSSMAMICMLLFVFTPDAAMAQRHGGERTEHRDRKNNNGSLGRRNEERRNPDRQQSADNNKKHHAAPAPTKEPGRDKNHGTADTPRGNGQRNNANNHRGYRPGAAEANRRPDIHRPGQPNPAPATNKRPGQNPPPGGPAHNWTPGAPNRVPPGHSIHRPPVAPPPPQPMRPAHFYGYHRPVPPPSWRPGPRPLFSTVLGLTFGSAINMAIDALITNGYSVDGYTDNMVYVNDAVQLNMRWPFGVLLYNNGQLCGSEFTYSSDWRDLNRYNMAYARLSSLYGPPVSSNKRGGDLTSTWWGPGGQYVTLRFDYRAPESGGYRYYTTLSFGI